MKTLFAALALTLGMASANATPASAFSSASMKLSFLPSAQVACTTSVGRACRASADCNFGEFCLNGQCVIQAPGNRCEFKTDCPPAEYCVGGVCRR